MKVTKQFARVLGLATMSALAVGLAAPAQASPVPPKPSSALLGTWVNTNSSSNSVKQVIVTPNRAGSVSVDAFGACTPTLCEWGSVPAIVYGTSVSSTTGATFQSNQRFLSGSTEWSRTTLFGSVAKTSVGLRLTLRELTVFEDGSGRKNYKVTETFKLGEPSKPSIAGHPVASYRRGAPPALVAAALGTWSNVAPSGSLVKVKITGTTVNPVVQAFGQCSPTACNWGQVKGITYGASISSTRGTTVLAPYRFGFKNSQLVITYSVTSTKVEKLTIFEYSEFTDGSGRSNYTKTETFVRA
ncbi:MAG: hypothetical protein QOG01_4622 [Pseudonocardiales bacterium]|jgi:hypothetical protein|nr:hypothetical protein [Pseudonocardiales bacterium]